MVWDKFSNYITPIINPNQQVGGTTEPPARKYTQEQPTYMSGVAFGGITKLVADAPVNPNGSRNVEQVGPVLPGRQDVVNKTKISWVI